MLYKETIANVKSMNIVGHKVIGEIMDFLGSVITIAAGLWVGQMLIDWWKRR